MSVLEEGGLKRLQQICKIVRPLLCCSEFLSQSGRSPEHLPRLERKITCYDHRSTNITMIHAFKAQSEECFVHKLAHIIAT